MCFTLIMHNIYLNHCHWLYLYRYLVCVCVRVFPLLLIAHSTLLPHLYIFAGPSPGVVWAVCYVALCPMPRRMVCPAPRQQAAATTTITTSARTASFPPPVPRTWPPLMRSWAAPAALPCHPKHPQCLSSGPPRWARGCSKRERDRERERYGRREKASACLVVFAFYELCVCNWICVFGIFVYPLPCPSSTPLSRTLFTILLILSYESSDITFSYDGGPARPRGRANAISSLNADSYFCTKSKREKEQER